ncbi:AP-1-like transcription factor [Neolecta irregularis DAH-3]|uniref:AP-1-like transcription factor n=1 Tax=Neolecta irregularis (strain DAH-3) TaxID=1198029 RepID=A0A1U7LRG1_NEOID|nr:AP-1-like transcription factor [Neolecta irregularis DAH-3]|eukprot:OLL25247.1 AP-1-like transcription factor [Neolecta irregularis DAH-3]
MIPQGIDQPHSSIYLEQDLFSGRNRQQQQQRSQLPQQQMPSTSAVGVSKRTLQNRKAQKEFRERKASYVKSLEQRVRSYEAGEIQTAVDLQKVARRLKEENDMLRDRVMILERENSVLRDVRQDNKSPTFSSAVTGTTAYRPTNPVHQSPQTPPFTSANGEQSFYYPPYYPQASPTAHTWPQQDEVASISTEDVQSLEFCRALSAVVTARPIRTNHKIISCSDAYRLLSAHPAWRNCNPTAVANMMGEERCVFRNRIGGLEIALEGLTIVMSGLGMV